MIKNGQIVCQGQEHLARCNVTKFFKYLAAMVKFQTMHDYTLCTQLCCNIKRNSES